MHNVIQLLFVPSICLLLVAQVISGCSYSSHIGIRTKITEDQRKAFIAQLESEDPDEVDTSIHQLTLGMMYRLDGNYQASIANWQQVKRTILAQRADSITEGITTFILNNTSESYTPNGTEEQMLYLLQAANYLDIGEIDAARVEILQREQQIREYPISIPFPFIDYFAGMVFELSGEPDQALVSYRRAYQDYQKQQLAAPQTLLHDYARLLAEVRIDNELFALRQQVAGKLNHIEPKPNLTIIVANGLAPEKYEERILHFDPESQSSFTLALPAYHPYQAIDYAKPLRVYTQSPQSQSQSVQVQRINAQLAANIDVMERQELHDSKNALLLQAIARQIAKRTTSNELRDNNKSQGFENLLIVGLTEAFVLATESADLRSWNSMPAILSIYRVQLAPGAYQIDIPGGQQLQLEIDDDTQILRLVHAPFT